MVLITEELIRKRAEHNECIISTLEEISLHQQDIEKIEHLGRWCKDLKILYLQSNLIPKIENIGRLKELKYINLALNNIEKIENLEGCESLEKLDLTVNFVGEISSIKCLEKLVHFKELYLTGNPCAQYDGYREYVIAKLPSLKYLDGIEIERSERIKALQKLCELEPYVLQQEKKYLIKRRAEKQEASKNSTGELEVPQNPKSKDNTWYTDTTPKLTNQEKNDIEKENYEKEKSYWQETTDYTPESRIELHKHIENQKAQKNIDRSDPPKKTQPRRLQTDDGKILNVNECKFDFSLTEDFENNQFLLNIPLYRHLSTTLVDLDVQPTHVKLNVKGKYFQLVLPEEILADQSTAQRSEVSGHLLITMPKAKNIVCVKKPLEKKGKSCDPQNEPGKDCKTDKTKNEVLEVDSDNSKGVDFGNIINDNKNIKSLDQDVWIGHKSKVTLRENSPDFVDNDEVPPLI